MTTLTPEKPTRAPKLRARRPALLFTPGMYDGTWSRFDAWLRETLFLYVGYREITKPLLSADGQPVLDNFGRPRQAPDAPREDDGVRKGAVWFTKKTLRKAWFVVFQQDFNHVDHRPHYEKRKRVRSMTENEILSGQRTARTYVNYSHPMDTYLTRLIKDGRVIRKAAGRYMVSQAECERLDLKEVWDLHIERGVRWEGLDYTNRQVSASLVDRQRRTVRENDMLTIQHPSSLYESMRHPNQIAWNEVYKALNQYLYFDVNTVRTLARLYVIGLTETSKLPATHLTQWVKNGKVRKVLPGLYQSAEFDKWNKERDRFQRPITVTTDSWMVEWIAYFAGIQYREPRRGFTYSTILAYYEEDAPDEWVTKNLPDRLLRGTVANLLIYYVRKGYLKKLVRGYQLSDATMELFLPLWFNPETYRAQATHVREIMELSKLSVDDAITQMSKDAVTVVVFSIVDRIMELPKLEMFDPLSRLSKKIKQPPARLLAGYAAHKEAEK